MEISIFELNWAMITRSLHTFIPKWGMITNSLHTFIPKWAMITRSLHTSIPKWAMITRSLHTSIPNWGMITNSLHTSVPKWGMITNSLHTSKLKQKATHRSKLLFVSSAYKLLSSTAESSASMALMTSVNEPSSNGDFKFANFTSSRKLFVPPTSQIAK